MSLSFADWQSLDVQIKAGHTRLLVIYEYYNQYSQVVSRKMDNFIGQHSFRKLLILWFLSLQLHKCQELIMASILLPTELKFVRLSHVLLVFSTENHLPVHKLQEWQNGTSFLVLSCYWCRRLSKPKGHFRSFQWYHQYSSGVSSYN